MILRILYRKWLLPQISQTYQHSITSLTIVLHVINRWNTGEENQMRFVVSWSCILQQFSSTSTNGNICNINLCRSKIFQEIICYIWYLVGKCCKYWNDELFWWIVFVVWLTNERRLVLFPAGTIVRDPHHRESLTPTSRVWACAEPEFRLSWMKLCSSDNHYTTAPESTEIWTFNDKGQKIYNNISGILFCYQK